MADIIRQGTKPEDEVMIGTCEVCGTTFRCLQGDCKDGVDGRGFSPRPCKHAVCPYCEHPAVRVVKKKDIDFTSKLIIALMLFIVFPILMICFWYML